MKREKSDFIISNKPTIFIDFDNEITIENHKGIISFEEEEIKIKTVLGSIFIKGSKFEILYISKDTIVIGGDFISIDFKRLSS